jgi:hypothetical protein
MEVVPILNAINNLEVGESLTVFRNEDGDIEWSMDRNKETKYYIFGELFADHYIEGGIQQVLDNLKPYSDIALFVEHPNMTTEDFLQAYTGWNGYTSITQDEYNQLKEKAHTL